MPQKKKPAPTGKRLGIQRLSPMTSPETKRARELTKNRPGLIDSIKNGLANKELDSIFRKPKKKK